MKQRHIILWLFLLCMYNWKIQPVFTTLLGSVKARFFSDPYSNSGMWYNEDYAQLLCRQIKTIKKKSNKLILLEFDCLLDSFTFKCALRHEKGYSSPICFTANLSPDYRYITFQNETEHSASKQDEFLCHGQSVQAPHRRQDCNKYLKCIGQHFSGHGPALPEHKTVIQSLRSKWTAST